MVRGPPSGFLAELAATSGILAGVRGCPCLLIRRHEARPDRAAEPFGETTPPYAADEGMVSGGGVGRVVVDVVGVAVRQVGVGRGGVVAAGLVLPRGWSRTAAPAGTFQARSAGRSRP